MKKAKNKQRTPSAKRAVRIPVTRKIRILIADGQPLDRRGLTSLLQSVPDFAVVAECSHAMEVNDRCETLHPSLIILALRLPSSEGTTALSVIRAGAPEIPVLALAERGEGQCMVLNPPRVGQTAGRSDCLFGTDCLQMAVSEGATGTIRRSAQPEELFAAIRAVASGKAWYEAGTATSIMRHALARKDKDARLPLSERELEVAGLISEGRSNKEISQTLSISEPTVKKHVGHILSKLKLQDRLQIGLYVARHPLVLRRSSGGQG